MWVFVLFSTLLPLVSDVYVSYLQISFTVWDKANFPVVRAPAWTLSCFLGMYWIGTKASYSGCQVSLEGLTVYPHKVQLLFKIEEKYQVYDTTAVQMSLTGYSWSWEHRQRKVRDACSNYQDSKFLLEQGSSHGFGTRGFTETSAGKPSHSLNCGWWCLQERTWKERQLHQK